MTIKSRKPKIDITKTVRLPPQVNQSIEKMLFMSQEAEDRWNNADPQVRRKTLSILHEQSEIMQMKITIEMMTKYIVSLEEKVNELEKKIRKLEEWRDET